MDGWISPLSKQVEETALGHVGGGGLRIHGPEPAPHADAGRKHAGGCLFLGEHWERQRSHSGVVQLSIDLDGATTEELELVGEFVVLEALDGKGEAQIDLVAAGLHSQANAQVQIQRINAGNRALRRGTEVQVVRQFFAAA